MTTTQLIIIVVILTIAAYFFFGKKKKIPVATNKNFEDLSRGDRLEISRFGERNDFFTVEIKNKNKHVESDDSLFWYDFEGITNRNEDFWLQLESIDPVEMNAGITKVDVYDLGRPVEDIMKAGKKEEAFRYAGESFYFDEEGEATCHINEGAKSYEYSYREFTNEKDDKYITIEVADNEEPKAYLSFELELDQVKILS
jgi:hypothetical protein